MAILPSFNGGGAERITINLMHELQCRGHSIVFVVLNDMGSYKTMASSKFRVEVLGCSRLIYCLRSMLSVIKKHNPDIVFSTFGYINVTLIFLRLFSLRGAALWLREANLPSISLKNYSQGRLIRISYSIFYRYAELVICSSVRMQKELVSKFGVPFRATRILSNPIDEKSIRYNAIRDVVPMTTSRRYIAAGRLTYQKGLDNLMDMFAQLGDNSTELVLLGEGSDGTLLQMQAIELGIFTQIRFEGFVANPWAWFATADAFLLPSRWEGMPNAALEALACGVPVIATPESGGIAEVAAASSPGAVQVVEAGQPFIEAMRMVIRRPKDVLPPSLLPSQYRLESVVDTFVSWMDEVV